MRVPGRSVRALRALVAARRGAAASARRRGGRVADEALDAGRRAEEEHACGFAVDAEGVWHAPGDDRCGARAELESLGAGLHDV
jgi:hypothetical protein